MISEENGFLAFVKSLKGKGFLIIMVILGLVLLVVGGIGADREKTVQSTEETLDACRERIERELENTLSGIEGVGVCRVTISLSRGERVTYVGGNVVCREPAVVSAVSVSCEGGGIAAVRKEISETVSSLYSIGMNRVTVHKLEGGGK